MEGGPGSHRGLYRSTDDGVTWERLDGFESIDTVGTLGIQSVAFDDSSYVYGGTSSGVFRSTTPVPTFITSVEKIEEATIPNDFTLRQNYPNPFNPATVIEFTLPERGFARLSVVNLLGQEVAVLVEEELPVGTHRSTWNASGFPSGVYFSRFEVKNFIAVKRMVLLK